MRRVLLLIVLTVAALDVFAGTGRIIIVNDDAPGQGFNDPTPVAPAPGNDGTTLGQQRLNVFNAAAARWSTMLNTNVDIIAEASFAPITGCTATEAVLGQAGPASWRRDFTNAPQAGIWYPIALANKFAGHDLEVNEPDISVRFNAAVDNDTCLGESNWYYGLDGDNGIHSDLFVVVLHEIAHGLGVSSSGSEGGVIFSQNRPSVFETHTIDVKAGRRWDQMTEGERRVSLTNTSNLAWDGENVRSMVNRYLQPVTTLAVTEPAIVARNYDIGFATFGPLASRTPASGKIVGATDAPNTEGPTQTDGCTALTNAAAISGNVALVDRGSCFFVEKARNAQAAGATGLIIVDNTRDTCTPPSLGGEAPDITIPVISIGATDGDALKVQLNANANVQGALRNDPSQLAGTSKEGHMRLYAPCTAKLGSSKHHWDVVSTPNLLMEPSVNSDLLHGVDLTIYQLMDMGWTLQKKSGRSALVR